MKTYAYTSNRRHGCPLGWAAAGLLFLLLTLGWGNAAEINFLVNPSFEDGTGSDAPPWSLWEGSGGAVATPDVGGVKPSPRCWFNTGGGRNLAAANGMNLILDTTGTVPYHVKVSYYVPALPANATKARTMIRLHTITPPGTTYAPGDPIVLDDASTDGDVAVGSWVTKDFTWYNASSYGFLEYMSFRMYSHDDADARVTPAPDVYIDECVFGSDQYRNDLHGVVKDSLGAVVAEATVTLSNDFGTLETQKTGADGSYAFTKWVPYGSYSVNASKGNYTSDGPKTFAVSAENAVAANVVLTKVAGLVTISGKVSGLPTGATAKVTAVSSLNSVSATTKTDGTYSLEVVPDEYVVSANRLPLTAPAQTVNTFDVENNPINVTCNFTLTKSPVVAVYADKLPAGSIPTWANAGTLGGQFEPLTPGATPVAGAHGKYKGAFFDNTPMALRDFDAMISAPPEITGAAANYTVCAWLFEPNAVLPNEQTYLSWARRGGPDGSNCEMVYGISPDFGAAGHWGAADLPWGTPPTGGVWHNVIVTFDGTTETSYIDGSLSSSEAKTLNLGTALPILLGSGYWYDGTTVSPDIVFSGYIAQLEVFTAPASAEDAARLASLAPPVLPVATLSGKVVTSDNSSSAGFAITAKDTTGKGVASIATGADGTYSLEVSTAGNYTVAAIKTGYVTMPAPQTVAATLGNTTTVGDFTAASSTITGTLVDAATDQPLYNAVVQSGLGGAAVVTDATGAYTLIGTGCGGVEVFADALGYHCKNLLVTGTGNLTKKIALTAEAETGVLVNGGFEDVANDQPTSWGEKWVVGGLQFSATSDAFTGDHSVWYTGTASYSALAQYVPITAGSLYTFYFKAKADPEVMQWFPMVSFRSPAPDDGEMKGWIAGEPGRDGWAHEPPKVWTQYLLFHTYSGDPIQPFVRIAPPAGAESIASSFCFADLPPADKGCYVDDVVIDRVAADEPLVSVSPDTVTPPTLPADSISIKDGVVSFQIPTVQGAQYRLAYKDALTEDSWKPIGDWTPGTGSPMTLSDSTAVGKDQRFYRVEMK